MEADDRQGRRFGHGVLAGLDNLIDTTTGTLKCKASLVPEGGNLMVPGMLLTVGMLVEMEHDTGALVFSSVRSELFVGQPDPKGNPNQPYCLFLEPHGFSARSAPARKLAFTEGDSLHWFRQFRLPVDDSCDSISSEGSSKESLELKSTLNRNHHFTRVQS